MRESESRNGKLLRAYDIYSDYSYRTEIPRLCAAFEMEKHAR
jgi:hypothetical protein